MSLNVLTLRRKESPSDAAGLCASILRADLAQCIRSSESLEEVSHFWTIRIWSGLQAEHALHLETVDFSESMIEEAFAVQAIVFDSESVIGASLNNLEALVEVEEQELALDCAAEHDQPLIRCPNDSRYAQPEFSGAVGVGDLKEEVGFLQMILGAKVVSRAGRMASGLWERDFKDSERWMPRAISRIVDSTQQDLALPIAIDIRDRDVVDPAWMPVLRDDFSRCRIK